MLMFKVKLRKTNGEVVCKILKAIVKQHKLHCNFVYNKKAGKIRASGRQNDIAIARAVYIDIWNHGVEVIPTP